MISAGAVYKIYQDVIDEVVSGIRDSFLDEGVDEQVLLQLKSLWESKLANSKAVSSSSENSLCGDAKKGIPTFTAQGQTSLTGQLFSTSRQLVVPSDPNSLVPVQVTMPPDYEKKIIVRVPASCIHANKLQDILSAPSIKATLALPSELAANVLQGQVNQALQNLDLDVKMFPFETATTSRFGQVDGQAAMDDSSDEDDDKEDDDDDLDDDGDDKEDEKEDEVNLEEQQDEEPLNSGDDISDAEDAEKLFDVDNIIVCQFEKLTKARNKWKFYLKDGVMNLDGKDFVFRRATGEAEW